MPDARFHQWRPHPWHGLEVGPDPPRLVTAYIEITPFDLVKYEIDKQSGYLRVDRPQRTSSQPPVLYGFIPRTFCGEQFRKLSPTSERGDGDALDICVISERPITKSDVILKAAPVGGLQMVDNSEADDKIIAVLTTDYIWGEVKQPSDLPKALLERIEHYFLTYKLIPSDQAPDEPPRVRIEDLYGPEHAYRVIEAAMRDYNEAYGDHNPHE